MSQMSSQRVFYAKIYRMAQRSSGPRLALRLLCALALVAILGGAASLPNGDLANGTNGWGLQARSGAEASLSVEQEPQRALVVDIQKAGAEPWHVQLFNFGSPKLEPGKTYRLSFDAKAERKTNVAVFYQEDGGSWGRVTTNGSTTLETHWSRRSVTLTVNQAAPKSRLVIGNLGRSAQTIRLANFKIEAMGGDRPTAASSTTSNTPANLDDAAAAAADAQRLKSRQAVVINRPVTFTVSAERAQEFKGWGFYPSYFFRGWSQKSGHAFDMFDLPEVADALYALEPDLIRVEAQHYMFNGSIDESKPLTPDNIELKPDVLKDLVDQLQLAREHGAEDWIISVWSPPVSMKTLGSEYNDAPGVAEGFSDPAWEAKKTAGEVKGKYRGPWRSYLRVGAEQDYVNYYVHVLQQLEEAGCGRPVAVSLQNEPDIYAVKYPGCYYPPHQWRRVNKMLRATLDANGLTDVKIAGPDSAGPNKMFTADDRSSWRLTPGYFGGPGWPALKHDPELLRSLDFINIHTYHAGFQRWVREAMAEFPHLELWQTEWKPIHYGPENNLIPNADRVVITGTHLARDFTKFPVNRWLLWNAFDGRNRDNISALVKLGSDGQPILTDEYHVYKTIFDVVDPGWFVKHVEVDHPALQPDIDQNGNAVVVTGLAFASLEDDRHVVVLINTTQSPVEANLAGISGTGDRFTLQSSMEDGPERSSFVAGEPMELPPLTVTVIRTTE